MGGGVVAAGTVAGSGVRVQAPAGANNFNTVRIAAAPSLSRDTAEQVAKSLD